MNSGNTRPIGSSNNTTSLTAQFAEEFKSAKRNDTIARIVDAVFLGLTILFATAMVASPAAWAFSIIASHTAITTTFFLFIGTGVALCSLLFSQACFSDEAKEKLQRIF